MESPNKPSGTEPIISSLCLFNGVEWHSVGGLKGVEDNSIVQATGSCHLSRDTLKGLFAVFLSFSETGSTCLFLPHPQDFSKLLGSLRHSGDSS